VYGSVAQLVTVVAIEIPNAAVAQILDSIDVHSWKSDVIDVEAGSV